MLKVIKEKAVFVKYIQAIFHLTPQVERLFISFLVIVLFVHISACAW